MSKKDKMADDLRDGVACPISLAVEPTSEGRGSLRFYHEFNGLLLGTRLP